MKSSLFYTYPSTWMALFQTTLGDYSVGLFEMRTIQNTDLTPALLVFRSEQHHLSQPGENGFRHFYDIRADPPTKHVNCYDGQHVCSCHRTIRERMDETGSHKEWKTNFVPNFYSKNISN